MKRLSMILICILSVSMTSSVSFEFAERSFGRLQPEAISCVEEKSSHYEELILDKIPGPSDCLIRYLSEKTEGKRTRVIVSATKIDNHEEAKRYLIIPTFDLPPVGMKIKSREADNGYYLSYSWVSSTYYISITKYGPPMEEVQDIKDYYMNKYPPTYTVSATDLKKENINKYELKRHMQIIWNGEKYRGLLKSKADKYIGTLAQCREEATIRMAAGLCKEALIHPDVPPDQQMIYCPIALNFDDHERKKQWKSFEKEALDSDKLNFDPKTWQCQSALHLITMPVACKLNFTKEDYLKVRDQGDIPEQFPLLYATKERCARDREMKKDFRIYKDGT